MATFRPGVPHLFQFGAYPVFLELRILCELFTAVLSLQHTDTSTESGRVRKNGRIYEEEH